MSDENEKKSRRRGKHYVIIFDDDYAFLAFDSKRDLEEWVNAHGVRRHHDDMRAGQGLHELPDGRAVAIIYGHIELLETQMVLL